MKRGVALYLVGSTVLLALAGCGRGWLSFEEREPWRREAEAACVKSGAIKIGPAVTPVKAIEGPGVCGADYPFKVAALGTSAPLSYVGELRPPGAIPQPLRSLPSYGNPPYSNPAPVDYRQPPQQTWRGGETDAPMSLHPPGVEPEEYEHEESADVDPYAVPGARPLTPRQYGGAAPREAYPPSADPNSQSREPYPLRASYPTRETEPLPPLGPQRAPAMSNAVASLVPAATLACPMISALDQWVAQAVQPAAQRWFGQPVVEIKQISAYSCRGMNGKRGAPISEHAFGNALDIAAFTLADGRRIIVKSAWRGEPEEQGFLRDVQAAACEQFSTVLAPGSNVYHYDHIHVDLRRRRSGRGICKPAAVSGELVAQRAREQRLTRRGSGRMGFAPEENKAAVDFDLKLPRAIPGAD